MPSTVDCQLPKSIKSRQVNLPPFEIPVSMQIVWPKSAIFPDAWAEVSWGNAIESVSQCK